MLEPKSCPHCLGWGLLFMRRCGGCSSFARPGSDGRCTGCTGYGPLRKGYCRLSIPSNCGDLPMQPVPR